MANFAELQDNIVTKIIVISNADITDENGVEQEHLGIELCNRLVYEANWKQTSFNNNFRKQYGNVGYCYAPDADVFYNPIAPFPSWSLDTNYDWQPPTPKPNDGNEYWWDETTLCWVEVESPEE